MLGELFLVFYMNPLHIPLFSSDPVELFSAELILS